MGEDIQKATDLAEQQLKEYKLWLIDRVATLDPTKYKLSVEEHNKLIQEVVEIKTEMVRIEPNKNGPPTVLLCNSYPDDLHAFLSREDIPDELNLTKQGGVTLKDTPGIQPVTA